MTGHRIKIPGARVKKDGSVDFARKPRDASQARKWAKRKKGKKTA